MQKNSLKMKTSYNLLSI